VNLEKAFDKSDIVILPATETYKSANRAVEAIRQGCFVVAEPHPAWNDIPGIWIGNIREGIEWVQTHLNEANQMVASAQAYVREMYSPAACADLWRKVIGNEKTDTAQMVTSPTVREEVHSGT